MDVVADVRFFGNDAERLVAHIFGMGGGEAHPHLRHSTCHKAKQLGEGPLPAPPLGECLCLAALGSFNGNEALPQRGSGEGASVAVHILPEQCDLLVATGLQVAAFAQDALHVATAFAASGVGDDAVVAEVVAAAHDADEARDVRSADALRHDIAVSLCGGELHVDSLLPAFHLCDEVGQRHIGIGAHYDVGMILFDELLTDALCHAAEHADDEGIARPFSFPFQPFELFASQCF